MANNVAHLWSLRRQTTHKTNEAVLDKWHQTSGATQHIVAANIITSLKPQGLEEHSKPQGLEEHFNHKTSSAARGAPEPAAAGRGPAALPPHGADQRAGGYDII